MPIPLFYFDRAAAGVAVGHFARSIFVPSIFVWILARLSVSDVGHGST